MYRFFILMAIMTSAVFGAVITPENEVTNQESRNLEFSEKVVNSGINEKSPVYQSSRQQKSPSTQYFIPTYPTYDPDASYPVSNGYDGYLLPVAGPIIATPKGGSWSTTILSALVPISSYAISYGTKIGTYLWHLFLLLIIGGLFVTSICTFTPFCTITFLGLGINKHKIREQVSELARAYITPESMDAATLLVKRAIDKYAELQRRHFEEEERAKDANISDKRRRR